MSVTKPVSSGGLLSALSRLAIALSICLAIAFPGNPALANGTHVPSVEIFNGPAGPYHLSVFAVPQVKSFHITVYVTRQDGVIEVDFAQVRVSGKGPGAQDRFSSIELERPSIPGANLYLSNLPIDKAGRWALTVTVDSSIGHGVADMTVEAIEPPLLSSNIVILILLFAAFVAFFEFRRWRQRRGRQEA